jgi:Mg-chelatase subunit ChlD
MGLINSINIKEEGSVQQSITFGGDDVLSNLKVNYADDDPFEQENLISETQNVAADINDYLCLEDKIEMKSLLNLKCINMSQNSYMSTSYYMLTCLHVKNLKSSAKTSIDLVCVIDRSWSMKGEKLNLVVQSLNYLLDYLDSRDRLSLIVFDDEVQRLCNLLSLNENNKNKIKQLLSKVIVKGGTNLALAMQHSIELIKQRRYTNNVTSIFLLSDGNQHDADKKIKNLLDREKFFISTLDKCISINTFGYGEDHDANLMMQISRMADGNFYYVENPSMVEESFMSCLLGLLSVVAEDVYIKFIPNSIICDLKLLPGTEFFISKVDNRNLNPMTYNILDNYKFQLETYYFTKINQLISGRSFNFLFEIVFKSNISSDNLTNYIKLVDVECSMRGLRDSGYKLVEKSSECLVMLACENDNILLQENYNQDVVFHLLRLKAGDVLTKAKNLSESGNYGEAQKKIETLIEEIKDKLKIYSSEVMKNLLKDVEKVLIYLNPNKYKKEGKSFFIQLFDSQIREKHNMIGFNQYAARGQERFISSWKKSI